MKSEDKQKRYSLSEKSSWKCSVSCHSLTPKYDWWFYLETTGQLLLLPSPFIPLTSPTNVDCGSQLKPDASSALGAWGDQCFFPYIWSAWKVGTCIPVLPRHRLCGFWITCREIWRNGAPCGKGETVLRDSTFTVCLLHMCCSSCFYPAAVHFNSSAFFGWQWYSHIIAFFFAWVAIPFGFGTEVLISSPMTPMALGASWDSLCILLMKTWPKQNEYLM